jgi:hypothetical protein
MKVAKSFILDQTISRYGKKSSHWARS